MTDLSIIIPVYNVEKYVRRCLESVMAQNHTGIEIECIIVDDCGQDNSMVIVRQMITTYQGSIHFKLVEHENNRGLSAARNTGIRHANGTYLFFVDSDDYITDNCLQLLYDVVKMYREVQIVKGNHIGRVDINVNNIPQGLIDNQSLLQLLYRRKIPVMAWNTLIKSSLVKQWNLSFKEGLIFEDNLWSVELFRHTDYFVFVPDKTYYYEENPNSIMGDRNGTQEPKSYLSHKITIVEALLDSYDDRNYTLYTLYVVSYLMRIFDSIAKDDGKDEVICQQVIKQRNRLFRNTLQNGCFVLVVYELLLFNPFRYLMKFRLYRHNYNRFEYVAYKIAETFEWLHVKSRYR